MGHRGAVVGEVALRDCRAPADYLPGAPGEGFAIMLSMFNLERVMLGGAGLGVAPQRLQDRPPPRPGTGPFSAASSAASS
jgi:alkylation response protein AidB-like acyl-CoA dehydrogenase